MEVQQVIVFALFLSAATYLGWRSWKSLSKQDKGGCGKGCGCSADGAPSSV